MNQHFLDGIIKVAATKKIFPCHLIKHLPKQCFIFKLTHAYQSTLMINILLTFPLFLHIFNTSFNIWVNSLLSRGSKALKDI